MKQKTYLISALIITFLLSAALAGCSGAGSGTASTDSGAKEQAATGNTGRNTGESANKAENEKPFTITMINKAVLAEPAREDDPIIVALEKLTNTDLKIQWVPSGTYDEKLNATIASGQLPMVVLANPKQPLLINAMKSGQFWELGPMLKDYPNLEKAMNPNVLKTLAVDGKIYSLFRSRSLVGDGMIYRTDWLEKLGLKPPTTLDEMYEVIKAFATRDPDGNGKHDTIGLAEEKSVRGFKLILAATGGGNNWEVKDNKLAPAHESQAYIDAMDWYRRLYEENLMNKDFAITERVQNIDNGNKGLFGFRLGDNDFITRHAELFKINPQAELDTSSILHGKNGVKLLMDRGYNDAFFIPKKTVKTEEEVRRILEFFDKMSTQEGQNLFEWGIEGVHYTVKDGKAVRTPEQELKYTEEVIHLQQAMQIADGSGAMEGTLDKYTAKYKAAKKEAAAIPDVFVEDPAASYFSETYSQKSAQLDKIINDARIKYIMGEIDLNGWQNALAEWRKAGGDQVVEELNAQYEKDPNKTK